MSFATIQIVLLSLLLCTALEVNAGRDHPLRVAHLDTDERGVSYGRRSWLPPGGEAVPWSRYIGNTSRPGFPVAVLDYFLVQDTTMTLTALKKHDGTVVWWANVGCPIYPSTMHDPVHNLIIVACEGRVVAYPAQLPKRRWRHKNRHLENDPQWTHETSKSIRSGPIAAGPGFITFILQDWSFVVLKNDGTVRYVSNVQVCPFQTTVDMQSKPTIIGIPFPPFPLLACLVNHTPGHRTVNLIDSGNGAVIETYLPPQTMNSTIADHLENRFKSSDVPSPPAVSDWDVDIRDDLPFLQIDTKVNKDFVSIACMFRKVTGTGSPTDYALGMFNVQGKKDQLGFGHHVVTHAKYHGLRGHTNPSHLIGREELVLVAYDEHHQQQTQIDAFHAQKLDEGPFETFTIESTAPSVSTTGEAEDAEPYHLSTPVQYVVGLDNDVFVVQNVVSGGPNGSAVKSFVRGFTLAKDVLDRKNFSLPVAFGGISGQIAASADTVAVATETPAFLRFFNSSNGEPQSPLPFIPTTGLATGLQYHKGFFFFAAGMSIYGIPSL